MKKILLLLAGLVLVLIIVKIVVPTSNNQSSISDNKVLKQAHIYISELLKSPGSAEFSDEVIIRDKDNRNLFEVRGVIDADNSFGAKLRSKYSVKFHYSDYNRTFTLVERKVE